MAKSNRLIKQETLSGGRSCSIASLAVLVAIKSGPIPEGYTQEEGMKEHKVCTSFCFKPKLRQVLSEEIVEGVDEPTLEDEILDFIIDNEIRKGNSISFDCADGKNPSRLDFQHRLEKRGFKRWKNKEITFGLINTLE